MFFFFFNDTATTEIYTLSLHDALPISPWPRAPFSRARASPSRPRWTSARSEEHTSELQSRVDLVCRLLLEKKKKKTVDNSAARSVHALRRRRVARIQAVSNSAASERSG